MPARRASKAETPVARARRLALALPETSEKLAWGAPTFRVGTKLRVFAMFSDDHHGDGRVALWLAAPRGKQEVLVGSEPERYFRPPYVGPSGWIGVILARFSDDELAEHLLEAWREIAPRAGSARRKKAAPRARKKA